MSKQKDVVFFYHDAMCLSTMMRCVYRGHLLDQSSTPGSTNAEESPLLSGDYVDLGLSPFKLSSTKPSDDEWETSRPELFRYFTSRI